MQTEILANLKSKQLLMYDNASCSIDDSANSEPREFILDKWAIAAFDSVIKLPEAWFHRTVDIRNFQDQRTLLRGEVSLLDTRIPPRGLGTWPRYTCHPQDRHMSVRREARYWNSQGHSHML